MGVVPDSDLGKAGVPIDLEGKQFCLRPVGLERPVYHRGTVQRAMGCKGRAGVQAWKHTGRI